MNDKRRKQLAQLWKDVEAMRATVDKLKADAEQARDTLQEIRDSEDEAFNNLSESLQGGERGQTMQVAISNMDTALGWLEGLVDLEDATEALEALDNAEHG